MKKTAKKMFSLLIALTMTICGCSEIPDLSGEFTNSDNSDNESSINSADYNESAPDEFEVNKADFVVKLNAEGGVYENAEMISEGEFDGRGYVRFEQGETLTHIVNPKNSQHYRFVLAVRSQKGASISLSVKDKTEGMFYVPPYEDDDSQNASEKFGYSIVDCVYLEEGKNVFKLSVDKGTADIDYIIVENSDKADASCYRTGTSAVNPYASLSTVGTMKYLSDIYGDYSMTAVNVSVGTNAEADAVYQLTGRYPAIRGSELAYAVSENVDKEKLLVDDIDLAVDWSKSGGLVAYKWHWYSPNRLRSVKTGAFDLAKAFKSVNVEETALLSAEELSTLNKDGYISSDYLALITDIDKIAENLAKLEGAATFFEPLPNADSGLYWWGDSAENYKKLYALVFNRLCRYHKLTNLIFVYTGGSGDYFPGAEYCDIVGQSFFEKSDSSFAGRFSASADGFPTRKMLAVTSCDVMPSVDYMNRDNAIWLWTAIESGKYLIDENGAFSSEYNSINALRKAYNSTLMLTRDELPDIRNYAISP